MPQKTVLVTGSSRGLGKAIALRLAADGYDLVLHCRHEIAQLRAVAEQVRALGRNARLLQFDISERAHSAQLLLADIEEHGCYYGVVCNSGINRDAAFSAMSEQCNGGGGV